MDDDMVSQGGDRDPSPWPRRLGLIAVVIAVVAGGAVYLARPHGHAAARPQAAASAVPSVPPGPNGILGQTLAWDPGVRLPDAGSQPAWFSPATGASTPIGGLPAEKNGYQFTRVLGGWAVQPAPAAASWVPSGCGSCAGPAQPVWFLPDGADTARRIGTATSVAPAATAGTVWLTTYQPGASLSTATGTARKAGAGASQKPVRLLPGYTISLGTVRGLLLDPAGELFGSASILWNPGRPGASQSLQQVLAAGPGEIASTAACSPQCGVQVLSLATGKRTDIAVPAGDSVTRGAFSPDGKYLALQVSSGSSGDGGELAMRLEVAPTAGGPLTAVPGTFVSSDALVNFGWPAGSDSLVAEFSFTTKMQLASWRPGASQAAVTVIPPGPDQAALNLG